MTDEEQEHNSGAEAHETPAQEWHEISMPYLGTTVETEKRGRKRKRKLTKDEQRAAKTEWQRNYRELKRLAKGNRGRRKKFKTEEERHEASLAYHRAYGKKYRAAKKNGTWIPKAERKAAAQLAQPPPTEVEVPSPKQPAAKKRMTKAEKRAAKNEYNRKYHLLRKTGQWTRKNAVFSERVAKAAGIKTVKQQLAEGMAVPARELFASEDEWRAALRERLAVRKARKPRTPEEQAEYLRNYNREYRKRRRAEDLAAKQRCWTAEEWEEWRRKEDLKKNGKGSPTWLVREVAKYLAKAGSLTEDEVMTHLIANNGVDFIVRGAEAVGKVRCAYPRMVAAAARAVAFFISPDTAVMFRSE